MTTLEDLFDAAAEALLTGNLAGLSDLTLQIESADLRGNDRGAVQRLHAKALRNARLLDAASRGVRAAGHRMAEITRGPTLTTYDARGQKAAIPPAAPVPARRV